ncbi:MAG: CDP-diacylglycerol--glycerol-3-phosphate 3-phosphatidyltransferase [Propionibacteriaceae bacterium]
MIIVAEPTGPTTSAEPSLCNVPNLLTALRIVMVPIFGWMLLAYPDQAGWRIVTALVFAAAIGTDALDGHLARKHNLVTRFGKLADPIADKALTGMAFVGLSVLGELWWWVTITILIREWGITILRFIVLRYGVMAASRGGKVKTLLQTAALILFVLPLPHWLHLTGSLAIEPLSCLVMAAAWVITILTGIDYVRTAIRLRAGGRTSVDAPSP